MAKSMTERDKVAERMKALEEFRLESRDYLDPALFWAGRIWWNINSMRQLSLSNVSFLSRFLFALSEKFRSIHKEDKPFVAPVPAVMEALSEETLKERFEAHLDDTVRRYDEADEDDIKKLVDVMCGYIDAMYLCPVSRVRNYAVMLFGLHEEYDTAIKKLLKSPEQQNDEEEQHE